MPPGAPGPLFLLLLFLLTLHHLPPGPALGDVVPFIQQVLTEIAKLGAVKRLEKSLSLPFRSSQSGEGDAQGINYNEIIALLEVCMKEANPGSLPTEGSI